MPDRYQDWHDRFLESSDRFQEAMRQAILEHHAGVLIVGHLLRGVGEQEAQLQESIEELKQLVLAQGVELRALRDRLTGGRDP